jgi:hypothetical protein
MKERSEIFRPDAARRHFSTGKRLLRALIGGSPPVRENLLRPASDLGDGNASASRLYQEEMPSANARATC